MNELKATRGPWCTGTKARSMVFASDGLGFIADCASGEFPPETERANAALIASAPDLYAALECLRLVVGFTAIKYEGQRDTLQRAVDMAGLALKKARGEA